MQGSLLMIGDVTSASDAAATSMKWAQASMFMIDGVRMAISTTRPYSTVLMV